MAFCTQRKFPGQCYENNGLAEINKMKCYSSIKDHRAWSMDQSQQASYLVDAVHKGVGDTVIYQNKFSNGLLRCKNEKNEIKKVSKHVGTSPGIDLNACTCAGTKRSDSLKMFEITVELETMKLNNKTLENENNDLRNRIATSAHDQDEEENSLNHIQIMEEIILERNDLRELLDKFLGVTDQIIELKIQADFMKNMESEYKSLQTKFRAHQTELESLRNEKKAFEDTIIELQTNNYETNALKETNSKLEKDLYELSHLISASDNFIHEQDGEIKSKLQMITQLNNQIENLKVALSEAELKLNKKLRLEMDVELMEKELSIMIENSAESVSPYSQQVIDRQVEDLATAIKLTLGYMNYELENDEDDNLVEANRQLKSLLLESSNKILEFKDVINKQEQNLMKATNDFACKNDELTECLATVEDLKRQLANRRTTKGHNNSNVDAAVKLASTYCVDDVTDDVTNDDLNQETEMFVNEINLIDSQHNSDFESDGQEIEELENIFEKSCGQQEQGHLISGAENPKTTSKLGEMKSHLKKQLHDIKGELTHVKDDFKNRREEILGNVATSLRTLQVMNNGQGKRLSHLDKLRTSGENDKTDAQLSSADVLNRLSEKVSQLNSYISDLESKNEALKLENLDLLHQTQDSSATDNENKKNKGFDDERDICETSDVVPELNINIELRKLQLKLDEMTADVDRLQRVNEDLRDTVHLYQEPISQEKSLSKTRSQLLNETHRENLSKKSQKSNTSETQWKSTDIKKIENENEKLKLENENLVVEIRDLKDSENHALMNVMTMEKDLERLSSINEKLLAEINEKDEKRRKELDRMPPDIKELVLKNEELRNANKQLTLKINCLERVGKSNLSSDDLEKLSQKMISDRTDIPTSSSKEDLIAEIGRLKSENNKLQRSNNDLRSSASASNRGRLFSKSKKSEENRVSKLEIKKSENANKKLKSENENPVVGELKGSKNRARMNNSELEIELNKLTSMNEKLLAEINEKSVVKDEERRKYIPELGMPPDIKELLLKNEELRSANEQLTLKINSLESVDKSASTSNTGRLLSKSKKSEENWVSKLEMKKIENANEKLKSENENLIVEIGELKSAENRARMNNLEMEKELEKLSSMNEKLLAQLNGKAFEKDKVLETNIKQRDEHDVKDIILKNEELRKTNEALSLKIGYLERAEKFPLSTDDATRSSKTTSLNKDLTSEIEKLLSDNRKLLKDNEELRKSNQLLQQPTAKSSLLTKSHPEKLAIKPHKSSDIKDIENENEKLKKENENLVYEIGQLKNAENNAHMDILAMEKDLERLSSMNTKLSAELKEKKLQEDQNIKKLDGVSPDCKELIVKNEELRNVNKELLEKMNFMEQGKKSSFISDERKRSNELKKLSQSIKEMSDLRKTSSTTESMLGEEILGKIISEFPKLTRKTSSTTESMLGEEILGKIISEFPKLTNTTEIDCLPSKNDIVEDKGKVQQLENCTNLTIQQMESDLKKLASFNESLLVQLNDKEAEMKQFSTTPDVKNILKRNEELKTMNVNLAAEINELKNSENLARSGVVELQLELENVSAINKSLFAEINELRQIPANNSNIESDWMVADLKKLQMKNQKLKATNENLLSEVGELKSPGNRSHISILQMGKDLEKLAALNESLLALNETTAEKKQVEGAPDVNKILKQNQELKNANGNLLEKVRELQTTQNQAYSDAIDLTNKLETMATTNENLAAQIKELERRLSNERIINPNMTTIDINNLKNENENLKSTNGTLLEKIRFLEGRIQDYSTSDTYVRTSSSNNELKNESYNLNQTNEQLLARSTETYSKTFTTANELKKEGALKSDYSMEIDWMVADMKKIQTKNENLKAANEKLLSQISDLEYSGNCTSFRDAEIKNDSLTTKKPDDESDHKLIYASNRNIEIDWMKADMEKLQNKNEKLKVDNETLSAEIGVLKSAEVRAHKNFQQMERDLLRLSAINERLSSQLNDKKFDKKQISKAPVQDGTSESNELTNKIEELTTINECLAAEVVELRNLDAVKMKNDLKKLTSANESLKLQISELKLLSANDLKMESDWMAADMKKILSKNKKLNISNQNLLNEINELRREVRSMENRANVTVLQKEKELEKLAAINENLTAQLEKKKSKNKESGLDAMAPDIKKVQKKNEELKAANEKLLSVIINLKNSEKLAISKLNDLERELKTLEDTNKNLQDTLENYVEKDWNKPKTELERLCQLILNEGISALNDSEFNYMCKWFNKSDLNDFDVPTTSRAKNTSRKHCRICHQVLDPWSNICDCKQYEEKKRLDLLREIEETKLAIKHIQSSNDMEFDLNDVKNRLLKSKPSDSSDVERQYELKMCQSQGSVNVRAHILHQPNYGSNQVHK